MESHGASNIYVKTRIQKNRDWTLSLKLDVLLSLGAISNTEMSYLTKMRKLRNTLAHGEDEVRQVISRDKVESVLVTSTLLLRRLDREVNIIPPTSKEKLTINGFAALWS